MAHVHACYPPRRRIYENAMFIRQQLAALVEGGLNLQDFMIHCLRNCYGER